ACYLVVLSLSLTGSLTQVIKITVGRPRPDLLSRCNPDSGTVDPTFGLSTVAICHQSDFHILNDGFRSFPSGHSADVLTSSLVSFAGLTFLSLYIAGKLHLFDTRGYTVHHWHDVIAGSFLGLVTAYFAYRQYFRSLASKASHLPYSPRTQRLEVTHDHPAPGLPLYHTLQRPDSDEGEVELIRDALRRDEPGQLERGWEQTHSTESGFSHS
ncbi:phosphatidic acid phosphatase type 2/haloperoxidase, partial [Russula vinacea]